MDTIIEKFLERDNKTKLLVVSTVFLIYLVIIQNGLSIQSFVMLLLVFILFAYNTKNAKDQKQSSINMERYIAELEAEVVTHRTPEMVLEHVYIIHKPLKDLYHIRKNNVVREVVYTLKFLQIYDKQQYLDIVVMIEYFLKIHFNVMIAKYDHQTYYTILEDVRDEIINSLYSCYYNIPRYSKTYDSPNLERDLKNAIFKFQSISFKLLKIVRNKYNITTKQKTIDNMKNNMYHMM